MNAGRLVSIGSVATLAILLFSAGALYPSVPGPSTVRFAAPGAQPAQPYQPPLLGVGTRFGSMRVSGYTSGPQASGQIKAIGANAYRDGIAWASFDFADMANPKMIQRRRIMDFLPIAGARPLIVLGVPKFKLPSQGMPFTDTELAQFAAYVKSTVRMTRQYGALYEVWNEYNMKVGDAKPKGRVAGGGDPSDARAAVHYAVLAKAAVKAAREADPAAKVLVGAVGQDPDWKWTQSILREGALAGAAGLSVHLYDHCAPAARRSGAELVARVQQLQTILRQRSGGKTIPIYVSEFGWPTTGTRCDVSRERQGYNFAQYILESSALPWLRGSWIYEMKDAGQDAQDLEQNFGVYTFDDKPKPAACFIKEARAIVAGAKSVDVEQPRPGVFVLRAVMPDRQIAAVWTSDTAPTGRVRLEGGAQSARMMCGRTVPAGGDIPISQAPLVASYDLSKPITITISG